MLSSLVTKISTRQGQSFICSWHLLGGRIRAIKQVNRPMCLCLCSGGILQGVYVDVGAVKKLKDLPTRSELMQKIGRLIRKVGLRGSGTLSVTVQVDFLPPCA